MKNFYEILEVDKKASSEIIEKAYKTLVKKYHPDLHPDDKEYAEEQIKLINDAYDTLSDTTKREEYDKTLQESNISEEKYTLLVNENLKLRKEVNFLQDKLNEISINEYYNTRTNNYNENIYNNNNSHYNTHYNINNNPNYYRQYNEPSTNHLNPFKNLLLTLKNIFVRLFKFILSLAIFFILLILLLKLPFFDNLIINKNIILVILIFIGFIYFFKNR